MDKLGRLEVEQLKVTSTTPPADSGFYKIDETTMGVVGDLKFRHPKTGAMSSALTVTTTSAQGVEIQRGGPVLEAGGFRHSLAENGLPTGAWNISPHWDLANVITDISAGLTASVDYDVTFAGQPTVRIDIPAGTSGVRKLLGTIGATARIPEGWDLKNLCVATRSTKGDQIQSSIGMYIGDATNANLYLKDQDRAGHPDGVAWYQQPNEWRMWKVGTTAAGATAIPVSAGSPTVARRMRAKLMANLTASAQDEKIWIGFFGMMPDRKKSTIVITLDDGYRPWFDFVAPLARYYDIPVSMGIIGGLLDTSNKMTKAQARALANDKTGLFDLVNHTYNHVYLTDPGGVPLMTESEWIADALKNAAFLRNEIGVRGDGPMHVMYPGGRNTFALYGALRGAGFLTGRDVQYCWQHGQDQTLGAGDDLGRYVLSVLTTMEETTKSVADVKAAIDKCIARNEFGILQGHNFAAASETSTWAYENLEQVFAYLATKRASGEIEIKSWSRWWADLSGRPCDLR